MFAIVHGIIIFMLGFGFICQSPQAHAGSTCDYYASPNGVGNGSTLSTPFTISKFWSVARPGKTLCLLDGIYTGSSSMIDPPDDLSGASGNPITIKALNDGKVTINGQGVRRPVLLNRNNYFVLEGFNAHSSNDMSVVRITRSQYNVVRRVVAWDAPDGNDAIVSVGGSQHTLWEDVAAWGIGRKVFEASQGGNFTTCRRCWGRWEGSHQVGPKMTYTLAYNNYNMIIENSIGTWSGEKMQESYILRCIGAQTYSKCGQTQNNYSIDQPIGIFAADRMDGDNTVHSKILGSIAYITHNDKFPAAALYGSMAGMNAIEHRDNVAYIEPGSYSNVLTFSLQNNSQGGKDLIARNLTGIGGKIYSIGSQWKQSNISSGGMIGDVGSIFISTKGAQICKRYKDGILTNEPLWPWPMNQRIKDAMIQSGRSPVDVTQTIEKMFGPIPNECKTRTQMSTTVPVPTNLRILQVQ